MYRARLTGYPAQATVHPSTVPDGQADAHQNENQSVDGVRVGDLPFGNRDIDFRRDNGWQRQPVSVEAGESDHYETDGSLALKPQPCPVVSFPAPVPTSPVATPKHNNKLWKMSRVKPGLLIRRVRGYQISEDEYGVSYLFVVSNRKGRKRTKSDPARYEHSGFFNWQALDAAGRTMKAGG